MSFQPRPQFDAPATADLIAHITAAAAQPDPFVAARRVSRFLGAQVTGSETAIFGFWTPEVTEEGIDPGTVFLEVYLPASDTDTTPEEVFSAPLPAGADRADHRFTATFHRSFIPTERHGEYTVVAVNHIPAGTRSTFGALYRLAFTDKAGERRFIHDPLALSVPFGAAAPAELYDLPSLLADRRDAAYFADLPTLPDPDGVPRVAAPISLLEIHTATATTGGTIADLTALYLRAAEEIDKGGEESLEPDTQALLGYEAVQLMPIEPAILFEEGEAFWSIDNESAEATSVTVRLCRPYSTNWGYDVITLAAPSTNPVLLKTGRPEEFLDLVETLHTFPTGPIRLVLDVVYGHADNQTMGFLNRHFFAGANMYGQNLNYRHPVVRAILLEMQRRKSNYGIDGVRVDGAQDFQYWVREEDRLYHDDEYLRLMNDVEQEVAGRRYRPWMIFEDGRPWPRADWELASSYREVTKQMPRVVQWGPLTFAHNTPFLFTFWISKWWRIRELMEVGANWITGNSNHDTLRRGTQVDPEERVNTYLGHTLPEIFENGYDNPATRLFDALLPGVPMDFLNANLRAPWSFVRNTDARWAIKVVSEEGRLLDWTVTPERFNQPWAFPRLKRQGFHSLAGLRRFQTALVGAVSATEYNADRIAQVLAAVHPDLEGPHHLDGAALRRFARSWMDDVHEFCNLDRYRQAFRHDPALAERAEYAWQVRQFRHRERWLAGNLTGPDQGDYQHPTEGSVLFSLYRRRPEVVQSADGPVPCNTNSPESTWSHLFLIANLEGAPREIVPRSVMAERIGESSLIRRDWETVLAVPGLPKVDPDSTLRLENSQAILFGHR